MSGIQQMLTGGTYTPAFPTTIGQAFGGGFYAGKIAVGGGGVATHYLIVAPRATGDAIKAWGPLGVTTGVTSVIDGPSNTASLVALGASYAAATFCNSLNAGSGLNGYTDWYMPAKNELEVLYYFLKPTTTANDTGSGSNANAVSPEPISTNHTSSVPAQTSAALFISGGGEEFNSVNYYSSTEADSTHAWLNAFTTGQQGITITRDNARNTRAVRRIPV